MIQEPTPLRCETDLHNSGRQNCRFVVPNTLHGFERTAHWLEWGNIAASLKFDFSQAYNVCVLPKFSILKMYDCPNLCGYFPDFRSFIQK